MLPADLYSIITDYVIQLESYEYFQKWQTQVKQFELTKLIGRAKCCCRFLLDDGEDWFDMTVKERADLLNYTNWF